MDRITWRGSCGQKEEEAKTSRALQQTNKNSDKTIWSLCQENKANPDRGRPLRQTAANREPAGRGQLCPGGAAAGGGDHLDGVLQARELGLQRRHGQARAPGQH